MVYLIHSEREGYVMEDVPGRGFEYCESKKDARRFTEEEIDAVYADLGTDHPLSDISIIEE